MHHQFRRFPLCCLLVLVVPVLTCAQSQPQAISAQPIHALPLYQQCQALVDNNAAAAAIAALKDKDTQKRIKAAEALAKSCDSRATNPLLAAVRSDDDVAV